jgi:hypothetical protein
LETQVLAWDMQTNVAELNRLMGPSPHLLDNWISSDRSEQTITTIFTDFQYIGGIVDHRCLNFLFIAIYFYNALVILLLIHDLAPDL